MMFLFTFVFVLILSVRANAASGTEWFLGEDNWDCNQVCSNVGGSCDSSWEATGMTLDDCPWQTVASVYADGEYNCGNTHCHRSGGWGDLGCWYYTGGAGAFHSSNWNDAFACSESRSMAVRICPCIGASSQETTNFPSRNPTVSPTTEPTNFPSRIPTPLPTTEPTNFPSRNPTPLPTTEPTRFPTLNPTLDPTKLGYVDDCEWHELNKKNKFINSEQFFGFECPPNQVITDVRLQGNEGSVLNDNPTAISCCKLGGHSVVTDTCIDSFSNAAGGLDEAICEGNSAMVALYDLSDPTLDQSQWQYQGTKGITCCEIDYDTVHGKKHDFGIDRSNCQVISHSSPAGIFEVACPADMVLVEIRDNDPANGVQEVHEISCCPLHDMAAPTQAPTSSPTTAPTLTPTSSEPSTAPTTSCQDCLINARGQQGSDQEFVSEVEACLSLCCV